MAVAVTVLAGALGLIIGWFVAGYQKITEKLTEERRSAYSRLLQEADAANGDPKADRAELDRAANAAEFVCSNQMLNGGRIRKLRQAVDSANWPDERGRFFTVARYESQHNSYWGRRRRWRDYLG